MKKDIHSDVFSHFRAGKGTRTLDPDLGKVVLYQLSYSREDGPYIAIYFSLVKGYGPFFQLFFKVCFFYLRFNILARKFTPTATTMVVVMLIKGIQGQLKIPPRTAGTPKAGIP